MVKNHDCSFELPQPLLEDIAVRRCLLFLGAGFSKNAKLPVGKQMPDWFQLTRSLAAELGTNENNPLVITTDYAETFGRMKLIEKISVLLHVDDAKPGDAHKKLTSIMHFDTIYTTNFEYLLENAYSENKRPVKVIVGDIQMGLYSPQTHVNIIKMHGDLSHIGDMIITKEDYDKFLKKHPVVSTNLSSMFTIKTPLFIGYSISDPHLQLIRKILRKQLGKYTRKAYIVKFNASNKEINDFKKDNFHVINIQTNGNSREKCLLDFLCQISDFVNIKEVNASMSMEVKEAVEEAVIKKLKQKITSALLKRNVESQQNTGTVIKAVADLEVQLRTSLENFGLDKKELKKPFVSMVNHAITFGLLSPQDISRINKMRDIRNIAAHSGKPTTKEEVDFVMDVSNTIIKRIKNKHPTKRKPIFKLKLEKTEYVENENIILKGSVSPIILNTPISLIVFHPNGSVVTVSQIDVNKKGEFLESFRTGGPIWNQAGTYTVRLQYGSISSSTMITFNYSKKETAEMISKPNVYDIVQLSGKKIGLPYIIRGGHIHSITPDINSASLIIKIRVYSDDELWIKLPRTVIDSKIEHQDDSFFVLVDGQECPYTETSNINERELFIKLNKGTEEIEIIGTRIFGISTDLFSAKNIVSILEGSSAPRIDEKYLTPQTLFVNVGESVTWVNEDKAAHTVTSGTPESPHKEIFDSSLFMSGLSFSYKFTKKGTYRYFCQVHPWKEGKIIVK